MAATGAYTNLPAEFEITAKGESQGVTRSDLITAKTTGSADAEHVNVGGGLDAHPVKPREMYRTTGLHYDTWEDIDARSPNVIDFGSTVTFLFGLEGPCMVTGVELHARVNQVGDGSARSLQWRPWLGELLLGEEYQIKLQNELVEKVNVDAMHFERRLKADVSSSVDSGYQNAVGAVATGAAQVVCVPLRLPYNRNKPLVSLSMPEEHRLTFKIPAKEDLLRFSPGQAADLPATTFADAIDAAAPVIEEMFLRVHYTEVDQKSRFQLAQAALYEGHKYHISQLEAGGDATLAFTESQTARTVASVKTDVVRSLLQPQAVLFFVARDELEFAAQNDFSDLDGAIQAADAIDRNLCPDRFRAVCPVAWELLENNARIYNKYTFDYYSSMLHPRLFNSEAYQPIGVISHTPHPMHAEDHSLGHLTLTNLNNAALRVWLRKAPALLGESSVVQSASRIYDSVEDALTGLETAYNTATVTYRISVFAIVYNFLNKKGGRVWLSYT